MLLPEQPSRRTQLELPRLLRQRGARKLLQIGLPAGSKMLRHAPDLHGLRLKFAHQRCSTSLYDAPCPAFPSSRTSA